MGFEKQRDLSKEVGGGMQLLSFKETGIGFNNIIREKKTKNHLYYSQIYNGAGVAIGAFIMITNNNDTYS
jgi:hypothetical protein